MITRCLVLLAVSIAPTYAEPPTEAELKQWFQELRQKKENFGKDGQTGQDAYFRLWRDHVATLNVEEMTPEQLSAAQEKRALTFGEVEPRIAARLDELEKRRDADGVVAIILRMQFLAADASRVEDLAAREELLGRLLKHPGLGELVRTGRSSLLLRAIAELRSPEAVAPHFEQIAAVVRQIEKEGAPNHTDSIYDFYETMASAAPGGPRGTAAEEVRNLLHRYGERSLKARQQADPKADLSFAQRDIATLGGAAARGQLINHPAPALRIDWCSAPGFQGLESLRGKVVLLDFWTVNCGPCIGAFPKMRELNDRYKDSPFQLVGVTHHQGVVPFPGKGKTVRTGDDFAKEREVMVEYFETFGLSWPMVMTNADLNSAEYGIRGIPSYALIDAEGVVREVDFFNRGTLEEKFARIDALLKEAGHTPPAMKRP